MNEIGHVLLKTEFEIDGQKRMLFESIAEVAAEIVQDPLSGYKCEKRTAKDLGNLLAKGKSSVGADTDLLLALDHVIHAKYLRPDVRKAFNRAVNRASLSLN